jgi:hypothetical protein
MLLEVVEETRRRVNDAHKGFDGDREGEWREHSSKKLSSEKHVSEVTLFGGYTPGSIYMASRSATTPTKSDKPDYPFRRDNEVSPWVFGNWWSTDTSPSTPSLLIGLCVRVGTGPEIEDAEGNTTEQIWYRGTNLRIRTDDSKFRCRFRMRTPLNLLRITGGKFHTWEVANYLQRFEYSSGST